MLVCWCLFVVIYLVSLCLVECVVLNCRCVVLLIWYYFVVCVLLGWMLLALDGLFVNGVALCLVVLLAAVFSNLW